MAAFIDSSVDPPVRGYLHQPENLNGTSLVLTHGAGANCNAPLLVAVADALAERGVTVLRCDLPFRQQRPFGPPHPGVAARDRAGLKNAVAAMRGIVSGRVFLGGHSYGGRQATMLCAEEPEAAAGLLLLSYPLHPPRKPEQLRTQHFPQLNTTALFIHGTRDPFGSIEEMETALTSISSKHTLLPIEGAGHDLGFKGKTVDQKVPMMSVEAFTELFL